MGVLFPFQLDTRRIRIEESAKLAKAAKCAKGGLCFLPSSAAEARFPTFLLGRQSIREGMTRGAEIKTHASSRGGCSLDQNQKNLGGPGGLGGLCAPIPLGRPRSADNEAETTAQVGAENKILLRTSRLGRPENSD